MKRFLGRVLLRAGVGLMVAFALALIALALYASALFEQREAETEAVAAELAPQPWWGLDVSSVPSYISAAKQSAEKQVIDVPASAIFVIQVGTGPQQRFFSTPYPSKFAVKEQATLEKDGYAEASLAHLEAALTTDYGHVSVSGETTGGALKVKVATAPGVTVTPIKLISVYTETTKAATEVTANAAPAGEIVIRAIDLGDAPLEGGGGDPVVLSDVLPAGLQAAGISGEMHGWVRNGPLTHNETHGSVTCTLATLSCEYAESAAQFNTLQVRISVIVEEGAVSGADRVSVRGGGAPPASRSQQVTVSEAPVPFGVETGSFRLLPEEEGGLPATQAGAHPFQMTTTFAFNDTGEGTLQPQQPRTQSFLLPPGIVGDAQSTAQCSLAQFDTQVGEGNGCPAQSAIGMAVIWLSADLGAPVALEPVPVFNLPPAVGEPARFGIEPTVPVLIDTSLRSGSDYGVTASVHNLAQGAAVIGGSVTLWGEPGDHAHDSMRGWRCLELTGECATNAEQAQTSLLTMPSACGSAASLFTINSWTDGAFLPAVGSNTPIGFDGCNHEEFEPEVQVQPTSGSADTPTGINVHLRVPQEAGEQPGNVAEADVRNTTVTLPAGLQLNPAAASGLTGCTEQQIGFEAARSKSEGRLVFHEESEAERLGETPYAEECPESSRVGKVTVHTKLLPKPLTGYVYQAAQDQNPFGSLLALYVVAEDREAGVRVRLAGEVKVEGDGQLVSSFPNTPQLPFEEFDLEFFSGSKAPLASSGCGEYRTSSEIEPWSSGKPGEVLATPSSLFDITSGPGGSSCASVGGFTPAFAAGTTNDAAAAFSPLVVRLRRNDGEQTLSTVSMTMPPGLAAMIANVQQCPEPQASTGQCPAASQIGHVHVTAGVGGDPVSLPEAGKSEDPVYLTGPYKGAPFGLSIVAHAEAGPFNLGTVIVRGRIHTNPQTAQVTIETEPAPTRLQGIPLDLREIEVATDKPRFVFNPTNCQPMSITGTVGASEGASEAVQSRFEAADCASLPFKPGFKVYTHKGHTRRHGAYLRVHVTSGSGQANIRSVFVKLPKILPSRTDTLKLACSAAQFAADPAGCPKGSVVGYAVAKTPVLAKPLRGPAIFVSHGGAAFPDLDVVLQGEGLTVDLTGNTNIVKGITSSDFKSVPDVPVSSFDLTLPEKSNSALAATGNLCFVTKTKRVKSRSHGKVVYRKRRVKQKRKLIMPTTITGQNGAQIKQATQITVEGCGKKAKGAKAKRGHRKAKGGHGRAKMTGPKKKS